MKTHLKYTMLVLIILYACKKEPPIFPPVSSGEYCPEQYLARSTSLPDTMHKTNAYPTSPNSTFFIDYQTKYILEFPTINPENPFEVAFLRQLSTELGPLYELCIFNFCTNELKTVTDQVQNCLHWGKDNWLLFIGLDGQVKKIKSDGIGLYTLTDENDSCFLPQWSPNGQKIVYSNSGSLYIMNQVGVEIKQISVTNLHRFCWKNNNTIVFSRLGGTLHELNIESNNEVDLIPEPINGAGISISSDIDENIYFSGTDGIYKLSNGGQLTTLDTNFRTFQAHVPQLIGSNQLLLYRIIVDTSEYNINILLQGEYLSLFNLNTNEERIINLPE